MLNLMLMDDEVEGKDEDDGETAGQSDEEGDEEIMEISFNALSGSLKPKTIRIPGQVKRRKVSILIDSGSTHSFIDEKLVKELKYKVEPTQSVTVTVANGDKLHSTATCNPLTWVMQGMECQFQMRVLKLGGSDMVLGVDWLSQFNPVVFDFQRSSIKFSYQGMEVELKSAIMDEELLMMEGRQMNQWIRRQPYGIIAQLQAITEGENAQIPTMVQTILKQYTEVFVEPKGMPPPRFNDHRIPLKEGAQPFKIRPYRCPYVQKAELKKMVKEMLEVGIIQ